MADDIKIIIGVEDDDVLKSIKNHQILEKRVEELTKEYAKLDKLQNKGKLSAQDYARAVQQLDKQIDSLNGALKKGGSAVDQLATGMNLSGKAARRNEIAFQQAGYQVQDFIVQVQGGTNPLIAFSQQASQLAGFFAGPWGAMIGLGIAAASSLAMAFLATGQDAETLKKNLDGLEDKLKDFNSAVKDSEEIMSSFVYAMESVTDTQIAQAWSNLGEAAAGSFEASFMAKVGAFLGANLWTGFETWSEVSGRLAGDNFANAFGDAAKGIVDSSLLDEIGRQIEAKNVEYLDATIEGLSGFTGMTVEGARFLEYLINARDAANGFTAEVKDAASELNSALQSGEDLSKLNLAVGIGEAKKVAELLAENMNLSLADALSLVNLATSVANGPVLGGRGRSSGAGSTPLERILMGMGGETGIPKKDKPSGKAKADPLKTLQDRIALEQELLGKTEAQQRVIQALGVNWQDYSATALSGIFETIEEMDRLNQKAAEQEQISKTIESSMNTAFMSMVDGTKSVSDAFKDMARTIIADLYQIYVVKQITGMITGAIDGAIAGPVQGPNLPSTRASGGTVMSNQPYLVGEKGPEIIMPQNRGHVMNADLTAKAMAGGGESVNIVQNFNFSANGDDSVKKLIAQAAPQIANMTQKQIMDSRRRGGAMKSTFG